MDNSAERFAFLGREFLTWLWFEAERNDGGVDTPTFGRIGVDFGQRLSLETGGNTKEGSTVQADAPSQAEEARTALRTGKKVAKARLLLDAGERQYQVNLDAESLTIAGAKLPTMLGPKDSSLLDERLRLIDELEAILDEMYVGFVKLRMDEARWAPVREAMREWVAGPAA